MWTRISTLTLVLLTLTSTILAWECPPTDPDNPCHCVFIDDLIWGAKDVRCEGAATTQENIDSIMTSVKAINNFVNDNPTLVLSGLKLPQLDMTIFNNTKWASIRMSSSSGGLVQVTGDADLNVQFKDAIFSGLSPSTLLGLFRIKSVSTALKSMYWTESDLAAYVDSTDFSEATSLLPNLEVIWLYENGFVNMSMVDYSGMSSLRALILDYNEMESLGEGALSRLPTFNGESSVELSFYKNKLTNEKIHPNCGISDLPKDIEFNLDLEMNEFEYISAENFEGYLSNPNNYLVLRYNKFFCDSRMKWLKDGRDKYESRVRGVDCENDPGQTIFTTDLV